MLLHSWWFRSLDNVLSTSILLKELIINFFIFLHKNIDFLGVWILSTFQFEQAISPDLPTHPKFNIVRIKKKNVQKNVRI